MNILSIEHLTRVYGTGDTAVTARNDVSFTVEAGEFIAIIGSSGSDVYKRQVLPRPFANQRLHVVDAALSILEHKAQGEIVIGDDRCLSLIHI